MPLLSTNLFQSSSLRVFTHLTLLLPVTLAVGCSGLFQRADIIDYTVTETEYHAELKARQSPTTNEPTLAAATPAPKAPVLTPPTVVPPVISPPVPKKPVKVKPVKAKLFDLPKTAHTKNVADSKTGFTGRDPISAKKVKNKKVKNKGKKLKVARALPGVEYRDIEYINTSDFTRTFYATAGLGISRVNPDTSASATFSADEIIDGGGQVALGFDVAKRLSLEVHAADLGSTGLAPNGRVSNNLNGVSALIYTSKNLNQFRRRGWNGYARLGYTQLQNTAVGVPFESKTTNSALFGVGAEYNTPWGFGFRADLIASDNDVQYGQLGMVYRAGKRSKKPRLARALPDPAGNIPTGIVPSNNATGAVVQPVIINDNVPGPTIARGPTLARAQSTQFTANPVAADPMDDLRLPKPALSASPTRSDSCGALNGTLKDVNFYTSSADLTQAAMASLNKIASTLNTCTSRNVIVSAHTDSEGSVANNNSLSKKRARNVAFHLARKGVSFDRISAVAYGESQPIASNDTAEGRSQNRRVELLVQ